MHPLTMSAPPLISKWVTPAATMDRACKRATIDHGELSSAVIYAILTTTTGT